MVYLLILLLGMLTSVLNGMFDTPHEPESRPDKFELCQSATSVWIEWHAHMWFDNRTNEWRDGQEDDEGPVAYVCDGTGVQLLSFDLN